MAARAIRVPLAIEAALADQIAAVAHAQLTAGRLRLHGNLRGPQAARRTLSLQFSAPPGWVSGSSHRSEYHMPRLPPRRQLSSKLTSPSPQRSTIEFRG